jgi:dTMP kinase
VPGGLGAWADQPGVYAGPPKALLPQSFFVALEGGEGSGKTSILSSLVAAFPDVLVTREPGGTPEGLALRGLLLSEQGLDWDAGAELLLMTAARVQHVNRLILPALEAGRLVVCDRFVGSSLAYQGAGRGLPEGMILDLHARFVDGLLPDLTIVLDVDPRVGLSRSVRRLVDGAIDEGRFEKLDLPFHERVRAAFLAQAASDPGRHCVVDAGRSLAEVVSDVTENIRTARIKT